MPQHLAFLFTKITPEQMMYMWRILTLIFVSEWQNYITHPFCDFISLPWQEFVLEHNRHHASTVDLLMQGEFGWDPEEFQYAMLEWTWRHGKYPFPIHPFGLIFTGAALPLIHFL